MTSNHTGDAHDWFTAAVSDVNAPERELYYFDLPGSDYESWNGVKSLPKLNWGSAELRRRFATADDSLLRRWLRPPYGLDGWRVDVANMTGRRGADAYTHEGRCCARWSPTPARTGCCSPSTATTTPVTWTATAGTGR
ncbi:alpha-amylase family glycosyl hydrolase [Micromonospora sp. BRA006-A]|nr:alpha-amylase family glycosyl hydrolase [Micromonospora sp. BRA006-A]